MKREEQSRIMLQKIMKSAIDEFNEHDYESASLNHICTNGGISKGIIYHYFKDKDELYLNCVKVCYENLVDFYHKYTKDTIKEKPNIKTYMLIRLKFFKKHPEFRGFFFHTLLRTPVHLRSEVERLRENLDDMNFVFYKSFLSTMKIREDITLHNATNHMIILQNAFNDYFRKEAEASNEADDFEAIIERHEKMIPEWIDLILYGIVKEEN